jgi:16S rRNA (cytosine967-C5)-methyltransferase
LAERPAPPRRRPVEDPARDVAYQLLRTVARDEGYANLVLPRLLAVAGLSTRDAALATELGYGALRAQGTLDAIIDACSSRAIPDIEPAVLDLLRLGAYQLLRTRIPPHAAVAATVELVRSTGNGRSAGFVNAILRRVAARDYDEWIALIGASASPLGMLALRYAHPGWIVAAFADALRDSPATGAAGDQEPADLEAALAADDERPVTHLVAWPGREAPADLARDSEGAAGRYSPFAVHMTAGGDPARLSSVREGRAAVQDEGSQMCAIALTRLPVVSPPAGRDRSGERWLDLCAGPGGKAALLAALAAERDARLTANELHPHRAELLARATRGWGVEITVGDGRELTPPDGGYDRVLLDAPCTGLGALRRRPEARWRKTPDDLDELLPLQAGLIDAAVRLVRPGGVIGYVTCSPHPAETVDQVQAAIRRHPGLTSIDAPHAFSPAAETARAGSSVQLWPHRHGTDAMFFAALRRPAARTPA